MLRDDGSPSALNVILITGAIREPLEFLATVERALSLVRQGRASHIIVSTWAGQIASIPGLAAILDDSGILVVQSTTPEDLGKGAIHAQFKSVMAGLLACPPGSRVLRCRTDKTLKLMGTLEDALDQPLSRTTDIGQFKSPFRNKISILGYSSTAFMWMSDFCFFGDRDDLLAAMGVARHFEEVFFNPIASPELRVLSWPFYQNNVFLLELFSQISHYSISHALVVWSNRGTEDLPSPLARLLALHAAIHASSFLCGRDLSGRLPQPSGPLLPLLTGRPERHLVDTVYIAGFRGTRATSSILFDRLLNDGINRKSGSTSFDDAANDIADGGYSSWRFSPENGQETLDFIEKAFSQDSPMVAIMANKDLKPFIGRSRSIAAPASSQREQDFKAVLVAQFSKVLNDLGISYVDPAYGAIAQDVINRPNLIMASLEATVLFWCGMKRLMSNDPTGLRDAWILIGAAAKGRSSDAQIMRGWLFRNGVQGYLNAAEAETAYGETLRDLTDAARKNIWPALVMIGLFRLDGADRHFDARVAASTLEQAAKSAGEYSELIGNAARDMYANPPTARVTMLLWRESFGKLQQIIKAAGLDRRMPPSLLAAS
ncbi:hypothetical protein [Roseomonas elaeocarpi]|uniref:SIR2-like domain-containing protein n=1 Tax=Roseomonas elaeocarpi TaxID=907779 RepID=A0ABV6JLM5_9PROT